jgi:hypothetical protein
MVSCFFPIANDYFSTTFGQAIRCFIMRRDPLHIVHLSGRLYQLFLTYCLIRKEDINLRYWELTHTNYRSIPYSDLLNHVNNHAALNKAIPGKIITLPRSFARSQRAYDGRLRDELACVQYVGMPQLFFTITANPSWEELERCKKLFPRDESNRIDMTNRLLHTKIEAYMKLILQSYIFGVGCTLINLLPHYKLFMLQPVRHYVYVIEFQNRGGAHLHMLLTLDRDISTPADIDEYITATIPDPQAEPELHEQVVSKMLHVRCRPKCRKPNIPGCTKGFPYAYRDETIMDDGRGIVAYRYGFHMHHSLLIACFLNKAPK